MDLAWPLMALAFSFCGALIVGFNHWAHIEGTKLVILRWVGVAPLALLAWLVLPWPHQPLFYAVAAVMGAGIALSDKLLFDAAAHHGGRLTALYIPIKMLLGFTLWAALVPSSLHGLLAMPLHGLLVVAGFAMCSMAMLLLRQQDASRAAIFAVLPVAGILAVGDVVAKYALGTPADGWQAVVGGATAFLFVTTSVGSLVGFWLHGGLFEPTKREVLLSAAFGAILMLSLSLFLVTLAAAPNPGYVGAITMLSALWLAIDGYLLRGERSNWWGGVALVGGAICVALGAA